MPVNVKIPQTVNPQRSIAGTIGHNAISRPAVSPFQFSTVPLLHGSPHPVQRVEFGLADPKNINHIAEGSGELTMLLRREGVEKLIEIVKDRLAEILLAEDPKIPLPKVVYEPLENRLLEGTFNPVKWTVTINSNAFIEGATKTSNLPALMNTIYHETRHCEQYWHAAKKLATSMSNNAESLAAELNIPEEIAVNAIQNMYPTMKELKKGKKDNGLISKLTVIDRWVKQFRSIGRSAFKKSLQTGVEIEKIEVEIKMNEAKEYIKQHPNENSDMYKKFERQYKENYEKYKNWVHEEDAWRVGDEMEKAVFKKQQELVNEALMVYFNFMKKQELSDIFLISEVIKASEINEEKLMVTEVAARIETFKEKVILMKQKKEDSGEYDEAVSLLTQSADATKSQDLEEGAATCIEAVNKIEEK